MTVSWQPGRDEHPAATYDLRYIDATPPDSGDPPDPGIDSNWTEVENVWRWPAGRHLYVLQGLEDLHDYLVAVRSVQPGGSISPWSLEAPGQPLPHPNNAAQSQPNDPQSSTALPKDTPLPFDVPLSGFVQASDSDYFSFTLSSEDDAVVCYTTGDVNTLAVVLDDDRATVAKAEFSPRPEDRMNFRFGLTQVTGSMTLIVRTPLDEQGTPLPGGPYVLECQFVPDSSSIEDAENISFYSETAVYFSAAGDRDYFRFHSDGETGFFIFSRGTADTRGRILNDRGEVIAFSDDRIFPNGPSNFAILEEKLLAGVYFLEVEREPRINPFSGSVSREFSYVVIYPSLEAGSALAGALPMDLADFGGHLGDPRAGTFDSLTDSAVFQFDLGQANHVLVRALAPFSRSTRLRTTLMTEAGVTRDVHQRGEVFGGDQIQQAVTSTARLGAGRYYLRIHQDGDPENGQNLGSYFLLALTDSSQSRILSECLSGASPSADPLLPCQWHLDAVNVRPVWAAGYSGAGVEVLVADDGIDDLHEDLKPNLDPSRVYDFGSGGNDVFHGYNAHGTAVAGLIAARDNDVGGRGVAPRATLRVHNIIPHSTTAFIVQSLARDIETVAIMNNSWGRRATHLPLPSLSEALFLAVEEGVTQGYGGRGVLYVKAAGNDYFVGDNANYEPLQTHYGIMSVCAVGSEGKLAQYSESGANLWVCGPSSGGPTRLYTSANYNRYTDAFGGTSGAAPIVSGVAALIREANPRLTWRDIKLILASSAKRVEPDQSHWREGGRKYENRSERYSHNVNFGFGLVDAEAAVHLARRWTKLPPFGETTAESTERVPLSSGAVFESKINVSTDLDFVEWVLVETALDVARFRSFSFELESPSGVVTNLSGGSLTIIIDFEFNVLDFHAGGMEDTVGLASAAHLGVNPVGDWTLRIFKSVDAEVDGDEDDVLESWRLTVYGHRSRGVPPSGSLPEPKINAIKAGLGSLTVSWSLPPGSGPVDGYSLRYIESDAPEKSDQNWRYRSNLSALAPLEYTISGLKHETRYDVQVAAERRGASGSWSATRSSRTLTPGPLEARFESDADCKEELCRAYTGVPAMFEDVSSGIVRFRTWEFGDGAGSRSHRVDHSWAEPGFYTVTLTVGDGKNRSTYSHVFLVESSEPAGYCEAGAETLCLRDSRYQVRINWWNGEGQNGTARVVHAGTNASGLFRFFHQTNWEVLVKLLDGCPHSAYIWFFGAATTDFGYRIVVTDTVTGGFREYENEPGQPAPAITDVVAFDSECSNAGATRILEDRAVRGEAIQPAGGASQAKAVRNSE